MRSGQVFLPCDGAARHCLLPPAQVEMACAKRPIDASIDYPPHPPPPPPSDSDGTDGDAEAAAADSDSPAAWTALLDGLLHADPSQRCSAHQALARAVFAPEAQAVRAAARRNKSASRDASPTLLAEPLRRLRRSALGISDPDAGHTADLLSSPARCRRSVSGEPSPERLANPHRAPPPPPVDAGWKLAGGCGGLGPSNSPRASLPPKAQAWDGTRGARPLPRLERTTRTSVGGFIKQLAPLVSGMLRSAIARGGGGGGGGERAEAAAAAAANPAAQKR
jgi:hypothetical protein